MQHGGNDVKWKLTQHTRDYNDCIHDNTDLRMIILLVMIYSLPIFGITYRYTYVSYLSSPPLTTSLKASTRQKQLGSPSITKHCTSYMSVFIYPWVFAFKFALISNWDTQYEVFNIHKIIGLKISLMTVYNRFPKTGMNALDINEPKH